MANSRVSAEQKFSPGKSGAARHNFGGSSNNTRAQPVGKSQLTKSGGSTVDQKKN